MPTVKLPLSGDVVQSINPFTWWLSPIGSQFGVININLGRSSAPEVEEEVLSEVGSYGKQLGRIGDVLIVLLKHLPADAALTTQEREAIDALTEMLGEIADIKERHSRRAMRLPPSGHLTG